MITKSDKMAKSSKMNKKNIEKLAVKGRKNIRKVITVRKLEKTTKEATKREAARKQRVLERQELVSGVLIVKVFQ